MKAPFPYFGGKSRVAGLVWERFGDVPNYVEPFAGSLAVLLAREEWQGRVETVNDKDMYLANFWRAMKHAADEVAEYADWPVNEADLTARHNWLVNSEQTAEFKERMMTDPEYFDAKFAGWWVWGISAWIGSGWCAEKVENKRPHLMSSKGVHSQRVSRQRPGLGDGGTGVHRKAGGMKDSFKELQNRLSRVRVCCGDWKRVMGHCVTTHIGLTGVFLDPPYCQKVRKNVYSVETDVSREVREWAIENGGNPKLRIALCGYEGEHKMPDSWECVEWKANGGYGNQADSNENAHKERIWFSPHCLKPDVQRGLFEAV